MAGDEGDVQLAHFATITTTWETLRLWTIFREQHTEQTAIVMTNVQELVERWLRWDRDPSTRAQIEALQKEGGKSKELEARMTSRLLFGTAGIRSRMEAGFGRLNQLTVIQTTHGFARHLKASLGDKAGAGVAIGFDGRYNSRKFARLATNVFIRNGIPVYLFSEVCPTPVVSWAVIHLKCAAGLMVTASHNPKEDNGYKAYWSNGAQIIGPNDDEIIRYKEAEPEPKDEYWQDDEIEKSPLFRSADSAIEPYFKIETGLSRFPKLNEKTRLKFTYSAFHGIGYKYATRLMRDFGFPASTLFSVPEQQDPNPDFPTVAFPNPEEGRKVLDLPIRTADQNDCRLIFANDPDADRIQLAERQADGSWRVFTGNEMGVLMTWWTWKQWRAANPNADLSKVWMLNSAVSSQIVATIAQQEGFRSDVTLTGFKWMGNEADAIRARGDQVLLAWEESIGYMPGHTLDKDGVSAMCVFAEIANWLDLEQNGRRLSEQLFTVFEQYGFHLVRSSYWLVPSPATTTELFGSLRKELNYPKTLGGVGVKFVRDLTVGYDNAQPGNKPRLPVSSSSEMVTFTLADGSLVTLRASGTEPKIKYYIELRTAPGKTAADAQDVGRQLDALEKAVVEELLRPEHFKLIPRK